MKSLIEPLEPRQMFSAATVAATDAVIAFRNDLRSLSAPLGVALVTYQKIIGKMSLNVAVFQTPTIDSPLLVHTRTDFTNNLRRLSADITIVKTLLNQDIVNLVLAEHLLARHPTNSAVVEMVSQDEALLTTQAQDDLGPIGSDCDALVNEFYSDAQVLENTHPIDASLALEVGSLQGTLSTVTSEIVATDNHIVQVTAPYVISALAASNPPSNEA